MAVKDLIQVGDPVLTTANLLITDFSESKVICLLEDLTDTMRKTGLVGIAAPQIGENYQLFLTEPRETQFRDKEQTDILRVFINPQIKQLSAEESIIYEGCGSVDAIGLFGPVNRPREVTIEACNEKGKKFTLTCDGILARIIQHEMDHLNGKVFLERIDDKSKLLTYEQYMEFKKNDKQLVEASKITKILYSF